MTRSSPAPSQKQWTRNSPCQIRDHWHNIRNCPESNKTVEGMFTYIRDGMKAELAARTPPTPSPEIAATPETAPQEIPAAQPEGGA